MQKYSRSSEHGFGHIGLILAVVGVIVVGGLVAWRFLGAQKPQTAADKAAETISQQIAQAKCDYSDKDLCKFFTSWKLHKKYKMVGSNTAEGTTSNFTFEIDGDNTHSIMTGELATEMISIGSRTTYTKAANGTWWKQTVPENNTPNTPATQESKPEFQEPSSTETQDASKPDYKFITKEACGSLTCFKYQIIDTSDSSTNSFIWFDTKDYQLRRSLTESSASKNDTTFSYDNVTVKAPATYKELGPNQYLMPGSNEPTTIPTADFHQ